MANDQELIKEVYPISILKASQQNEGEHWISEDVTKKWTDNPQGVSPEYPYEFCCTRYYTYKNKDNPSEGKGWQPWDTKNISLWAHYGMNATPYQLLLGNPYESIYQIEASGATREAYVIIDGDGISTGEIILQGGYENKDQKFNLKIDELSILDPINNIEHHFEKTNNYLTINLGDNWKCRFERSNNNGNPVLKIIGIGPNPESSVTPPSTIELAPTDSCFKCNLGGKYQKKIVIQAKNNQKHITATATWTVTAIRDKNGDGIWRYQIMPSIDRVVRNIYYKRIGEDDKAVTAVKDVWNIGDANSLKFDLEKDTYGKSWEDIDLSKQKCIIRIRRPKGNNEYEVLYNQEATSNPEIIDCDNVKSMFAGFLSNKSLLEPHMAQYTVEMLVEDPDYGEGFSVVDKCNLIFEYIVSESGKDGEDGENGKDGTSSVFNLSNDSGSFAYKYNDGTIKLSDNDKTTNIQYIVESNYKCCDGIKVGENTHNDSESGTCGRVNYQITKNTKDWTLEVTGISKGDYSSVFAIPITGIVAGKEVGTATFKMIGIKDLNKDGVYAYRIEAEHPYSTENSSESDKLELWVHRDVLIEGFGLSAKIPILVDVVSKNTGKSIGFKIGEVQCGTRTKIDTGVTMNAVQSNKGVILQVYAKDDDYKNRTSKNGYYFTGESEDIPWTATKGDSGKVDYEELKKSITTISCSNDNIVVIPGKKYTLTFKDISGKNISGIEFNYSADSSSEPNFSTFFGKITENGGIYEVTANTDIPSDPYVGTITYGKTPYQSGEITYTWVGDSNSDGVYYDYEIQPSAQVLGYTEVDGNLAFNIGEITITCKSVRHEGVLKTQTKGSGYILVGSNKVEGNNFGQLDGNGQVTITLGEPPKESTEESKKLYYSKKTSFRVYWFTADNDYAIAAESTNIPFIEMGIGTEKKKYYQVDSELIDVVPNTAIDATTNLQAYTGSGTFIVDPKTLKATFEYKSDAPGYYLVRFNKAQYKGTGDIYFANTTITPTQPNTVKVIMGPELMRTTTTSTGEQLTLNNINGPYGLGNYEKLVETSTVAWIKCPSVHVSIYKENTFDTLLFEDTVVRTGLDGYYWNVDENGWVSVQSNGDVMTSINQTANSIVSIASGVSPNLCKGAATGKTSPFTWVIGSTGEKVTSYHNSKTITAPSTDCRPIGTGLLVSTSGNQHTYSAPNFELSEGYYGISFPPNSVTTGGTIDVGYDGPLLYENYSAPSGKAIAISSEYNGKGIKFTVPETLRGNDCILSFYASQNRGNVCVKANNNTYQFTTTNSVKRYVIKLNNLQSTDVIIYKDSTQSTTLYISSIQFEKGSLVTDWKDYGQDVSTIIQDASSIRAEVESFKDTYATKTEVNVAAEGIRSEVARIEGQQAELKSTVEQTPNNIRTEVETKLQDYATTSYVDNYAKGIDMATVVNDIRTAGINIKNGETDVTDGKIYPNSGSVELTGQVIATNFMVKSEAQSIEAFRQNDDIVMCITTWGNAKGLGTNETITLGDEDNDVPVFVVKSNGKYFILNPLLLTNSGIQPAIYDAISTLLYEPSNIISLNDIISHKYLKTIFKYSMPSQKEEGGKKIDVIQGATAYKGVMCKDQNFENLDVDPPTLNTNSLLNNFTIKFDRTITAPVYILAESNAFITFVPIDIYKVIKYTEGKIRLGDENLIFLGSRVSYSNGKVSLSSDSKVLYKLQEYPKNLLYFEKNFTCISNESVTVKLKGFITKKIADKDPPIFITNIETTEFKYLFYPKEFSGSIISDFVEKYKSAPFNEFSKFEKQNFLKKYSIEVKYKEFLDSYYTNKICQKYGIDYNDFPEFQQTNN